MLARVRHVISGEDIQIDNVLPVDDETPRQLYLDNPSQWFLTSTEARIPVTALRFRQPIRAFTPTTCDAPIISPETEWARDDIVLERVHRRNDDLFYRMHAVSFILAVDL